MPKFNLSEAAKEILDASVASKRSGQDSPSKLPASVAYGTKEADIGEDPTKTDDELPDYTKGTPTATPPGATPPVGSEPMKKLSGQPQETMGRADLKNVHQSDATDMANIRDRIAGKLAPQMMQANPGATFQSYHEGIDMSDDVAALLEGENLSEEFKNKATTIFEAAVLSRVETIVESIETNLMEEFQVAIEQVKEDLAEKLDEYLNYMTEEWMQQNELAIERGLRAEIVEEFIGKLRNLFVESYIDIPEEKVDAVEELVGRVEELEDSLNEEIQKNIEFKKQINEHKKIEAIYAACEGLTQTQVEKIKSLAEGIEFTTEEEFADKLETIKESYFPSQVKTAESSDLNEEIQIEDEDKKEVKSSDPMMNAYAQAITKTLAK
ncbi:MAG: hypothetical protein EBU90_16000 [Proteobacteria bacterium]|nr:hypothetical protein [Pseudomonadota bacterium]